MAISAGKQPVGILSLKRCRKILSFDIGAKAREQFCDDPFAELYPVNFTTPAAAAVQGLPPTGWIDFGTKEITIVVDDTMPYAKAWTLAQHTDVHEHLHWAWDLSPHLLGVKSEAERFILNIFLDACNEQRALLESYWASRKLAAGRRIRHADYMAIPPANRHDPTALYAAGFLVLAAHTTLMTRGRKVLARIHSGSALDARALDRLWKQIARVVGPCPAHIQSKWMEAFDIAVRAWQARDRQEIADFSREFKALFPEPPANVLPIFCPLDVGGHVGATRSDAPPGRGTPSFVAPPPPDSGDLDLDPDQPDADEAGDAGKVDKDVQAASQPAKSWGPGAPVGGPTADDDIQPADPHELVQRALSHAASLREHLKLTQDAVLMEHTRRGRADAGIIARDEEHPSPFRSNVVEEAVLGPGVCVVKLVDTSGSMHPSGGGKWEPVRLATMAGHLAMQDALVPHFIATSRTLKLVASPALTDDQARSLIAGMGPSRSGGDNFERSLGIAIDQLLRWSPAQLNAVFSATVDNRAAFLPRDDYIRIMVIIHDGQPCDAYTFREEVQRARRSGIIVTGLGLDLDEDDAAGMERLFGTNDLVLASSHDFAPKLGLTITAAVERGMRAALVR